MRSSPSCSCFHFSGFWLEFPPFYILLRTDFLLFSVLIGFLRTSTDWSPLFDIHTFSPDFTRFKRIWPLFYFCVPFPTCFRNFCSFFHFSGFLLAFVCSTHFPWSFLLCFLTSFSHVFQRFHRHLHNYFTFMCYFLLFPLNLTLPLITKEIITKNHVNTSS